MSCFLSSFGSAKMRMAMVNSMNVVMESRELVETAMHHAEKNVKEKERKEQIGANFQQSRRLKTQQKT